MAKHDVSFEAPKRPLGKADLTFHISRDESKLGRLAVSQGGVEWIPKDGTYGYKMSWTAFSETMAAHGVKK